MSDTLTPVPAAAKKRLRVLFFNDEHSAKRKLAAQIAVYFNAGNAEICQTQASFEATDHLVQSVLQEVEIPFNEVNVKQSSDITREKYDLIIVLCKCFRVAVLSYPGFPAVLHWPVENPVKKGLSPALILANLRKSRDELVTRIKHLMSDGYLEALELQSQQLDDFFNDPTQGCLKFNREELVTGLNEKAQAITGFRDDELLGKPLHYLVPDDMVSRHALAVMDEGVMFRKTKLKLRRSSQEVVHVTATFKAIPHSLGQGGVICFEETEEDAVIQPIDGARGLERLSWDRVESALKQTAGNRTKASKILGVGRATFYRFLDREKARGRIPKMDMG